MAAADYNTTINTLRGHLARGSSMSGAEMKLALSVVIDAVSKIQSLNATVDTLRSTWDTQIAILQAKGTADASVEIDAADTALETQVDNTEASDAAFGAVTYTPSTGMDG